jgi:phage-related protein (TIGR01555 family)
MNNKKSENNQKNATQLKQSILDYALASLSLINDNDEKPKKIKFESPEVMGIDGKPVRADKLIEQYNQVINKALDSQPLMTDSANGQLTGLNQFYFDGANQLLLNNVFLGYAEYALLLQNGVLNSICSTPADKMTCEWIDFISTSNEDKDVRIKELNLEFERLGVKELFNKGAKYSFAMGGCLLYPHFKNEDNDDLLQKELILSPTTITKGSLDYLTIIEPTWYVPIRYNTDNPFSKWFYVPEYYAVMGKICHSTRVLKFMHNEAPNILKSQYNFNGIPLLQQAMPYVMNFETMRTTIIEIVQMLNLLVLKTGLQASAAGASDPSDPTLNSSAGAAVGARVRGMNAVRNNLGTAVIDFDNEDLYNLQMSLANLDKLLSQYAELMCIVPKAPATELLGISPQGFNASGAHEIKKWHNQIRTWQESIFRNNLIKVSHMAMLNIWGEIDHDISFEFKKLDIANELEDSLIAKNYAEIDTMYIDRGTVDNPEVRQRISNKKDGEWNHLELAQKDDENLEAETYPEQENLQGGNFGNVENPYKFVNKLT